MARQAGDAATEAAALVTLACAMPAANLDRARALLAEARAVAARAQAYQSLLNADITESDILEGLGEHELAAAVARDGIATARDHGLARTSGVVLAINLAEPLVSLGRWAEAADVIERTLQLFPPPLSRTALWGLSGDVALARGDLPAAAEYVASIGAVLDGTRFKDEYQLPLAQLDTELRLAQDRPGEALSVVGDALGYLGNEPDLRYVWPLLVAGARACVAAAAARDEALAARAAALRDRLRAEAGLLGADGVAQQAGQLTFTAEMMRADRALAGAAADGGPDDGPGPGDLRVAWDAAARAWEAASQPYPLASALLRSAEAALGSGDHDGGAERLRRAAALAEQLGAAPLREDIALLARRARIWLGPGEGADARASGAARRRPGQPFATGTARAHGPRVRGAAARGGRAEQPRDRQRTVHLHEDGQRPRVQHPRQARGREPRRGGSHRAPAPPLRLVRRAAAGIGIRPPVAHEVGRHGPSPLCWAFLAGWALLAG